MPCYLLLVDCARGPVLCLGVYEQEPAPALSVAAARLCGATQASGLGVVTATPPAGTTITPDGPLAVLLGAPLFAALDIDLRRDAPRIAKVAHA